MLIFSFLSLDNLKGRIILIENKLKREMDWENVENDNQPRNTKVRSARIKVFVQIDRNTITRFNVIGGNVSLD